MNFSANLARLQKQHGESNYKLAKELGVHIDSVKYWKLGRTPWPQHLKLIADHYGVTVEDLMAKEETQGDSGKCQIHDR